MDWPDNNDDNRDNWRQSEQLAWWKSRHGLNTDNPEWNYRFVIFWAMGQFIRAVRSCETAVLELDSIWGMLGQWFQKCWREHTPYAHTASADLPSTAWRNKKRPTSFRGEGVIKSFSLRNPQWDFFSLGVRPVRNHPVTLKPKKLERCLKRK